MHSGYEAQRGTVLVLGSFPPVISPAAAAIVAALRRELSSGTKLVTAAPRASAAALVVPLAGPAAAWRLRRVRRSTNAARLVLAVEPGVPISPPPAGLASVGLLRGMWALTRPLTLLPLRATLRRFDHVTVLISDSSPEVGRVLRWLRGSVDEIVISGEVRPPPTSSNVRIRVEDVQPVGEPLPGVTPLGPPEPAWDRFRTYLTETGRRKLGPAYVPLRLCLVPVEKSIGLMRWLVARLISRPWIAVRAHSRHRNDVNAAP